jgi:hypothetical protein
MRRRGSRSLIYVQDFTDTTKLPLAFEEALIYRLAADLAMPLTGDPGIAQNMYALYDIAWKKATAIEADEPTVLPLNGDFLDDRHDA